jgi:hypothetical protein
MKLSKIKLKNFRTKLKLLGDQERELHAKMKRLYDQFILDAKDDKIGHRQVQQAFFQIQKYRTQKLIQERLEFHPFFGVNPIDANYLEEFDEDEEDDDFLS